MSETLRDLSGNGQNGRESRIFALGGGKGGVGKTVLTVAVGIELASRGRSVCIVDADFAGANLHHVFGFFSPPLTLYDYLVAEESDINRFRLETTVPGLTLIAGCSGRLSLSNLAYQHKSKLLRNLQRIDADAVLLDIGAGSAFNQLDVFNAAHHGLVVVTPEPHAILDAYNFIKLALVRKLHRAFRHHAEVLDLLGMEKLAAFYHTPINFTRLTEQVAQLSNGTHDQWQSILTAFRPAVVFNMLEDLSEQVECHALQIAVQEMLNVRIKTMHFVRYDNGFRRAIRRMNPEGLFSTSGLAAADIRRLVDSVFTPQNGVHHAMGAKSYKSNRYWEEIRDNRKTVICSSTCSLWGNCRHQNGGRPCRIKMLGFLNQH
ncbi:P-loop NTPase [candidate division KSB1 bacterium]|nr:P-loop NTPase [candidate division KSB1 bacterium]